MRPAPFFLSLLLIAAPAQAALRSPQVMVSGTALANFFSSEGQAIAVVGDQQDITQLALLNVGIPSGTYTLTLHSKLGGGALSLYDTRLPSPPLYEVFPSAATPGWFTVVWMQYSPLRLVVNVFDAQSNLVGTTMYQGLDGSHLGLAVDGSSATKYAEDPRNPEGLARLLFYGGTGPHYGAIWLCAEDADGGKGDFADSIFLIEGISAVPVRHTSWGELKQRFR